jgi:hypothetical protein
MSLTARRLSQPENPAHKPFGCGNAQKFGSQRNFP